jgi:hypothetical protein
VRCERSIAGKRFEQGGKLRQDRKTAHLQSMQRAVHTCGCVVRESVVTVGQLALGLSLARPDGRSAVSWRGNCGHNIARSVLNETEMVLPQTKTTQYMCAAVQDGRLGDETRRRTLHRFAGVKD